MSYQRQKSTLLLVLILTILLAAGGWPAMSAAGEDRARTSAGTEPGLQPAARPEYRRATPRLALPSPDGVVGLVERTLTGLSAGEGSVLPPLPARLRPMLEALVQRWAPFYAALDRLRSSDGLADSSPAAPCDPAC